jgi:hypothetical protein
MRRAAALVAALLFASPALARCVEGDGDWITRACCDTPKSDDLYRHNVLGRTPERSRLVVTLGPKGRAVPATSRPMPGRKALRMYQAAGRGEARPGRLGSRLNQVHQMTIAAIATAEAKLMASLS